MSKLVLSNRIPRDYNPATFQEIVRLIEEQSNQHAEGKLRARHGAMTAAPTSGNWERGDFVWNSTPSVVTADVADHVVLGWICTTSGTPGTWQEVRVLVENFTPTGAATQAEQEAGSSTSVYVTPGRQQFHQSATKMWVNGDMAAVVNASYNVSSLTDHGTGEVTVNFTTAMSTASYCTVVSAETALANLFGRVTSKTSSSARYAFFNDAGTLTDPSAFNALALGDR